MTNKEAIEELKARKEHYEMGDGCEFLVEALEKGIETLENQKTGHWTVYAELTGEWKGTKKYACDKCGEKVGVFKSNYCPNCGAKMESEGITL